MICLTSFQMLAVEIIPFDNVIPNFAHSMPSAGGELNHQGVQVSSKLKE